MGELHMKKRLCIVLLVLLIALAGVCPAFADVRASEIASGFQTYLMLFGKQSNRLEKGQIHFSAMDFDTEAVRVDHVTPEGVQIPIIYHFFNYGTGDTALHFAVVKAAIPESLINLSDNNVISLLFYDDTLNEYSNLGRFYLVQNESGTFYLEMRYDLLLDPESSHEICSGVLSLLEKDIDTAVENLKIINSSGQ